jgi:hypothetical protein
MGGAMTPLERWQRASARALAMLGEVLAALAELQRESGEAQRAGVSACGVPAELARILGAYRVALKRSHEHATARLGATPAPAAGLVQRARS